MNFIDLTLLDRQILTRLQNRGMSANEGIHLINCEIYYLNYKDRAVVRRAIHFIGETKKKTIISIIHTNKRKRYLAELQKNDNQYDKVNCNYLFSL